MSGLLFLLKRNALPLAAAEAQAATLGKRVWAPPPVDGVLYLPRTRKAPTTLGLTHRILRVHAHCPPADLSQMLATAKVPFRGSYCVRLTTSSSAPPSLTEREASRLFGERGTVSLSSPTTIVEVVITLKRAYLCTRLWEDPGGWDTRRTHLLPRPHPSGTHPSLARAFVHLAAARKVHDPCCGSGGLLIEAGLAGMSVSGADLDPEMISRARANCRAFGISPDLRVADATRWQPRVPSLVMDLPYGRNTRPAALRGLLTAILARSTARWAVVGLPFPLTRQDGWRIIFRHGLYVHKGMTRYFHVLSATGRRSLPRRAPARGRKA